MEMNPAAAAARTALSSVRVNKPLAAGNRLLAAVHVAVATAAIAHRAKLLRQDYGGSVSSFKHVAMVAADLTLLFIWLLSQPGMWRPVTRVAFPERLRQRQRRSALPGVDVMVVTADPDKEPIVEVMNTVLSAMALDYPGGRLSVYLSDDAGSPLTLLAARKAYTFARDCWVPFCRKYNVQCPCPSTYFSSDDDLPDLPRGHDDGRHEMLEERIRVKKMYESLTEDLKEQQSAATAGSTGSWTNDKADHDAHVEIISDDNDQHDGEMMPMMVYVAREKRRTSPHHFKAGALNVLLRVSGLLSNSPYVLVLDCDMKCNSRSSAMEAMCFHLDPDMQQHLGFVQFPQMFHNLSSNDIYANELRAIFSTRWKGLDGLRGPLLSGTGFYARRDALYGVSPPSPTMQAQTLVHSPSGDLDRRSSNNKELLLLVASCAYEEEEIDDGDPGRKKKKKWGHQVGFLYQSVAEDYFTGYRQLFCRGWTSVYCYPTARPAFLGSVPTNLNDVLVQNKRWMSGMLPVGITRQYCPLLSPASLSVSVLQSMAFAYYGLVSLSAFPVLCYALITPLCFLRGVPLFPSSASLAASAFASSSLQHLIEVSVAKKKKKKLALRTWWNEQRFWMLNAVTAQLFACVTVFLGLTIDFDLTSKKQASNKQLYQEGIFDFTGCSTLLLPATTLTVLNVAALITGTLFRTTTISLSLLSGSDLVPQFLLMCYVAALSYPLLEGMFLRQDAARVPPRITALSVALAVALIAMFG